MMNLKIQTAAAVAALLLCGLNLPARSAAQASNSKPAKPAAAQDAQEAYCTSTGGEVEYRKPYYNTNDSDPSNWLALAGSETFCQYTKKADGSRIHISLSSLNATEPSLAALAYYGKVPWNGQGNGNPASFYCTQLGGSDSFGGVNPFGGGWVKFGAIDEVLEACIFPDNSTIDSWGLLYHSVSIIRGTNLGTVMKFRNPWKGQAAAK